MRLDVYARRGSRTERDVQLFVAGGASARRSPATGDSPDVRRSASPDVSRGFYGNRVEAKTARFLIGSLCETSTGSRCIAIPGFCGRERSGRETFFTPPQTSLIGPFPMLICFRRVEVVLEVRAANGSPQAGAGIARRLRWT